MMNKLANANLARVEHISFSDITIGYEELAISRARSDETFVHTNQARSSIDRQGNGDRDF